MSESSELHESVLRAVLYAVMELTKDTDGNEVLAHLTLNIPNYYGDMIQRELARELADYLADVRRDFAAFNAVYGKHFDVTGPARTTVQAVLPREGLLVEIRCVAAMPG